MGAWGHGPFENDSAGDLLASIRHGDFDFDSIGWAFEDDGYLEIDGGEIAIALVELVLAVRDGRAVEDDLDLTGFAAQLDDERVAWVRDQALRATSGAETSEAYDLWAEAGDLDAWLTPARAAIERLG